MGAEPTPPDETTPAEAAIGDVLAQVSSRSKARFTERLQILAFQEYLQQVLESPLLHTRNTPLYLRDMFDHYGTRDVRTQEGAARRFKLFDAAHTNGETRVLGQERLQNAFYRQLGSFCEKGYVDKLLLLHGPNGTAKSTFAECVMGAMEHYSEQPEGVLYRFNWIFSETADRTSFGFHEKDGRGLREGTFAYLEPEAITFQVGCEVKDHPLLLFPVDDRVAFLERALGEAHVERRLPRFLARGGLCAKCQAIYQALSNAYKGDWARIMQHVQVERLYVSQRYRRCAVVIQPQRNVDAASRPLNLEKSYRLPPILNHSSLSEVSGDLIDANRGVVEYSDFFKRPLELNKYLLTTSEKGTISLANTTTHLDCVFLATSNQKNLEIFKRNPDFPSFKGRFELIRAPYLLVWSAEEEIYTPHMDAIRRGKHIAPHTTRMVALWAILTRLRCPLAKHFEGDLAGVVAKLRPVDKARLYDTGQAPDAWPDSDRRLLHSNLEQVAGEYDGSEDEFEGLIGAAYEGRRGASPREIISILNEAASDGDFACLSPLSALKAIRHVTADASLYEFLRLRAESGYQQVEALTDDVEREYRRVVRDEVHRSLALVEEGAYTQLFEDYFLHAKSFDAGERIRNQHTNQWEQPDEALMTRVEEMAGVHEEPAAWRKNLIMRIAAWAIDHPGQPVDYREIFGDIFEALRGHYYREREDAVTQVQTQILRYGTEDWVTVDPADQERVVSALERLKGYGYCDVCAKEALAYVLRHQGED